MTSIENLVNQYNTAKDAYAKTQGGTQDPNWIAMGAAVQEADSTGRGKEFTKAVIKTVRYN